MGHRYWTGICAAVGLLAASLGAQPAVAADLCVGGPKPGCFATLQAAIGAAQDGDTIKLAPGTYAGGITIGKSVELIGTSAASTVIRGGGPVVTVGDGVSKPTVSISRLTITGGLNDSSPGRAFAAGGGMRIEPGAAVTIAESAITDNQAAPEATFDEPAPCGSTPFDECAFATGGGIDNSGALTVTDTRISGNLAGSAGITSFAAGGGIHNHPQGTLTLRRSVVSDNRASVSAPDGRNTDGGGIVSYGVLTMDESVVSGNTSEVDASVPSSFFADFVQEANAGGLYLAPGSTNTIKRSQIRDNRVLSSNTDGDASAEAAGIDCEGSVILTDSNVAHNTARAVVPPGSGFLAETDGGGLQVRGSVVARGTRVSQNSLSSASETGQALASGGGVFVLSGSATLDRTVVTGNSATAHGVGGFNLGGGIASVSIGGPAPQLMLTDSVVTANRLTASEGVFSQGGGLYTADPFGGPPFPVTLTRTVIAGNKPDQCVGC